MAAGGAAIKARGCPPICCANRFPPRPLRGACACAPAALTATPPAAVDWGSSILETLG